VVLARLSFWLLCLILLLPVLQLLPALVAPVDPQAWAQVRDFLLAPALHDTLLLTAGVCLLSLLFGLPAAWCVANFRFAGRRVLSVLLVLPLAVPPYVAAYVSTEAREALIPWLVQIRETHGIDAFRRAEIAQRYGWLIVMLAAVFYPYVFLAARAAFGGAGCRLAETARSLGTGPWGAFFRVGLPLARPALAAGLFLVAMETINEYGAVEHFGVSTLTPILFRTWFGLGDVDSARRIAAWVLLAVLAARFLEIRLRGRAGYATRRRPDEPRQAASAATTAACWLACLPPVLIGFIYPCATLLRWLALSGGPERPAEFTRAALHSLGLGLAVTALCLLAALLIAAVNRLAHDRAREAVARIASVAGYASPGAVLAIAIFGTAAAARGLPALPPWLAPALASGALLWLVYGLVVRYFAIGGQMVRESLDGIPRGLDQGARLLGHGPLATHLRVHLPLLRPALAGAGILIFIDVLKELPLSLILRPFDFETLGTWTYGLADQGMVLACAAPALTIVALGSVGLVAVELLLWKRR